MSDVATVAAGDVPPDAFLLDVREEDEWSAGHAPQAVHIPLASVTERRGELPDGDVYVVCRSGGRSSQAVAWLNRNGYDAMNVAGGMGAWQEAGLPMVSETGAPATVA